MDYYQIECPKQASEAQNEMLIAQLSLLGFESFEETDSAFLAYIPEKDFSKELLKELEICRAPLAVGKPKIKRIPEQNWNAVWESNYPAVLIAGRCYVYAPFHEKKPEVEFNIVVTPNMTFGTAHHETTSQIIELILDTDLRKKEVLDMGCGTGVLAILASLKNAYHVDAVDNGPRAYRNSINNIELNNITNITTILGDASLLKEDGKYDVIFANINKNILLRDIPSYSKALKQGGMIYFSGFYEADLNDINTKAAMNTLQYMRHRSKNNWVVAVFQKN